MVTIACFISMFQILFFFTKAEPLQRHLFDRSISGRSTRSANNLNASGINFTAAPVDVSPEKNTEKKGPIVKLSKALHGMSGEMQELICTATGYPSPSISWTVDGQPLEREKIEVREMQSNNESISSITLGHSNVTSIYICTGSNEYGTTNVQIQLKAKEEVGQMKVTQEDLLQKIESPKIYAKVDDDPMAPSNLQWTSNADGDVTLFWKAPEMVAEPNGKYTVYFTENEQLPVVEWKQLTAAQERLKIPAVDLVANTTYYVRVAVQQQNHISKMIAFSAPDNGPSGPPEHIRIEVDEAGNIVISWKKPQHINGDLEKYTLYFTRDPGAEDDEYKEWPSINILTSANEYSYKMDNKVGLRPRTLYRIRITATNNVGESRPSDVYEFETTAGENPVPTDVYVEVSSENSVVVRFNAVKDPEDQSAYIREYDVFVSPSVDAFVAQFIPVEASLSTFDEENGRITMTIPPTALSTNTRYWLKVQAHVPGRDVQSSKPRRFQTGAGTAITTNTS